MNKASKLLLCIFLLFQIYFCSIVLAGKDKSQILDTTTIENRGVSEDNSVNNINLFYAEDFEGELSDKWQFAIAEKVNKTLPKVKIQGDHRLGIFGFEQIFLQLKNLPKHKAVILEFDFLALGSWDGNCLRWGPDFFSILDDDGRIFMRSSFSARRTQSSQSYPGFLAVHQKWRYTGSQQKNEFDYSYKGEKMNALYRIKLNIPHKKADLKLFFAGFLSESVKNEAWALDNVKVYLSNAEVNSTEQSLKKHWNDLASENGDIVSEAVQFFLKRGDTALDFLLAKFESQKSARPLAADFLLNLHQWILGFPKEKLKGFRVWGKDKVKDPIFFDVNQRQKVMTAFVLQAIGGKRVSKAFTNWKYEANDFRQVKVIFTKTDGETASYVDFGARINNCFSHQHLKSDKDGIFYLKIPKKTDYIEIDNHDGRWPKNLFLVNNKSREQDFHGEVPDVIEFQLLEVQSIGGIVVKEDEEPIEGAIVKGYIDFNQPPYKKNFKTRGEYFEVKTNKSGRWELGGISKFLGKIKVGVYHPFYTSNTNHVDNVGWFNLNAYEKNTDHVQLLKKSSKIALQKTKIVRGKVFDSEGKPVKDSKVWSTRISENSTNSIPPVLTDEEGKFTIGCNKRFAGMLVVMADGHAPKLVRFGLEDVREPLDIKLEKGQLLEVKVIDKEGMPLKNAQVTILGIGEEIVMDKKLKTDKDGMIRWENAPSEDVIINIERRGSRSEMVSVKVSSGKTNVVSYKERTIINITAKDKITGKDILDFKVTSGIKAKTGDVIWSDGFRSSHGDGDVRIGVDENNKVYRIMAEGYFLEDTGVVMTNSGELSFAFELEKITMRNIAISAANKDQLKDVKAFLVCPMQYLLLSDGKISAKGKHEDVVELKINAKYEIQIPKDKKDEKYFSLVFVGEHVAGVLSSDYISKDTFELKPWAELEVEAFNGKERLKNSSLRLDTQIDYTRKVHVAVFSNAKTSTLGKATFKKVLPGSLYLARNYSHEKENGDWIYEYELNISPGQKRKIQIGKGGLPLVGKLEIPKEVKKENWFIFHPMIMKRNYKEDSNDLDSIRRIRYGLQISEDNTFRVENIMPGDYRLSLSIFGKTSNKIIGNAYEELAHSQTEFTVNEGFSEAKPYKLIPQKFQLLEFLKYGQIAPDFELEDLEGKTYKLSNLRGKYVLLDFWATWCGPCLGETPYLKKVYDKFGKKDNFVILGISDDQNEETIKKYINKEKIKWSNSRVEWNEKDKDNIFSKYYVRGIPDILLISPEGKVIAKDLRGASIEKTVAKFLKTE